VQCGGELGKADLQAALSLDIRSFPPDPYPTGNPIATTPAQGSRLSAGQREFANPGDAT